MAAQTAVRDLSRTTTTAVPTGVLTVEVDGQTLVATPKRFASGSVGYFATGKIAVAGHPHQVTMSVVMIGSKPK